MELGNILFDQCDGGYEIPRGAGFEEVLRELFDACAPDRDTSWRDYGPSFENNTFQIWPYSWCDCDCGYDKKEEEWGKINHHLNPCYQSRLAYEMKNWELMNDYEAIEKASYCDVIEERDEPGLLGMIVHTTTRKHSQAAATAHEKWCKLHTERNAFEKKVAKSLCTELCIPWRNGRGMAIHCTCDYKQRWRRFIESNNHDLRCQVARKSFLYKPTGFWVDWYKYPLRDAHSSKKIGLEEFRSIIRKCIVSLEADSGGPVLTLEKITQTT